MSNEMQNSSRVLPTVSGPSGSTSGPKPLGTFMSGSQSMDRSNFLRTAGSAAVLAALGISLPGCGGADPVSPGGEPTPPPNGSGGGTPGLSLTGNVLTIDLTASGFAGLRNNGGWAVIVRQISGRQVNVLAVNVDGTTIRAFSSVCPHQGCNNSWQFANDRFRCTCHDSVFEKTGQRVSGPANRDLSEFAVTRSGDDLAVTLGS